LSKFDAAIAKPSLDKILEVTRRITDAEQSFERAIALNKNQYDAHHRLALMKLLKKDTKGAESHLSAIKSMLKRCYDCDARSEIETRIAFIQKALDGEIKLD
jgi:thioredoxin-like negative regulator of GroEL